MKVAVYGIDDFVIGKKIIPDERLDKLKELLHAPKIIYSQLEFVDQAHLKGAQAVVCLDSRKDELIVTDLEYIEERLAKITDQAERQVLSFCQDGLNKALLLNELNFTEEQRQITDSLSFITSKPVLSVSEDKAKNSAVIAKEVFAALNMISFFTVNEKEVKSWAISKGTTAHQAAGCIHSDIQRGFIKAEITSCSDIIKAGGLNQAKSQGLMKLEDKDYVVCDADLIKFRFNV